MADTGNAQARGNSRADCAAGRFQGASRNDGNGLGAEGSRIAIRGGRISTVRTRGLEPDLPLACRSL
jgi:hypothetical protein